MDGIGSLPEAAVHEIPLNGSAQWVVAVPVPGGSVWVAVLTDGRVQAFEAGDGIEARSIDPQSLPPGAPPLLLTDDAGRVALAAVGDPGASPYTSPVLLNSSGRLAYVDLDGDLVVTDGNTDLRLSVDALPDARILVDDDERVLLLTRPTRRYGHGVLGDAVEAAGITLVTTRMDPAVVQHIAVPAPAVVEGLAPIWADFTGDGEREIIVTLSDETQGARVVVFDEAGGQIAAGAAIGAGYRWRHQLAAAPFGPSGELEIADVLTPHIGGPVEFMHRLGADLHIGARVYGYTSHQIGSRNLDTAVAGDLDGDGQMELLLPDQTFTELGAVRRTAGGANVAWSLPVGGQMQTNLAAVTLDDGRIALGCGHGQTLQLWLP